MSYNRLSYDTDTYRYNINSSMGVGSYVLSRPTQNCGSCFVDDPSIRMQTQGTVECQFPNLVDLDSTLKGITMHNTKCASSQIQPNPAKSCNPVPATSCCPALQAEQTRSSNPPCTLRETGINRWEWLSTNPQGHALMPFEANVSYRKIVKDNHRPIVPNMCDAPPLQRSDPIPPPVYHYDDKHQLPFIHWMPAGDIAKL